MKADSEDLMFDNVMELCSSAIRGSLIAPEGRKLVVADLSNIEGRVLAWLAGETWKIKAFAEYDTVQLKDGSWMSGDALRSSRLLREAVELRLDAKGRPIRRGHDLYELTYANSFGIPIDVVNTNTVSGDGVMRMLGKIQELSLGFGGSIGAFSTMGAAYGVSLPEEEILGLVRAWRKAHPAVTRFWYDLEKACRAAVANEGSVYRVRDIAVRRDGVWLRMRLPSGRYLCYPAPQAGRPPCTACGGSGKVLVDGFVEDGGVAKQQVCKHCDGEGLEPETKDTLSYMGVNQYTRKWERIDTYFGKLVENIVQATARDVFAVGMKHAADHGYEAVSLIHDEQVTETPDTAEYSAEHLAALMSKNPTWAHGLPLAAAGFETYRYRKD
jgi:DNA polymerase